MPEDHSLWLRRGVVAALAADAGIAAIVGARVYGPRAPAKPTWPFVRMGVIVAAPYEATCLDGMDASFAVHSFHRGPDEQGAADLNALAVAVLNGASIASSSKHVVWLDWTDSQVIGDPDGWHGIAQFQTVTASDF